MFNQTPLAIVTGAAHRLGKAFALTLAKEGYAVVVHYNDSKQAAQATVDEITALGGLAFPVSADLTQPAQVEAFFRQIDEIPYPLTVLVNSAAVMPSGNLKQLTLETWQSTLALNLTAPFLMAQQVAQRMQQGLIVNITDIAVQKTWTNFPAYSVSKAGLEMLTRQLARTYAPAIRVNAIAPGLALKSTEMPVEEWQALASRLPLKRAAEINELTATLKFLLENQYVTGETIRVDGGYSLI